MKKYILVLDAGTTNIKAFLFDQNGTIVGESREKTLYITDEHGKVEQDPLVIRESCYRVLKDVLSRKRLKASHIEALGITAQRSSFLLWDRITGKPLTNIITWQDKRAADHARKKTATWWLSFIRLIVRFLSRFIRMTKLITVAILKFDSVHSSARTGYLFETDRELRIKAHKHDSQVAWGTIDSWILWNLSGGKLHVTDYSFASSTGILDPFTLKWNGIVRSLFDIPDKILPELRDTRSDFGVTTLFGDGPIPIRAVIADQQASLYGQCCFVRGDMKCTNGTGSFIDINTGGKPFASRRRLYPLVAWRIDGDTVYMLEGQSQNTGNVVDWIKDELSIIESYEDSEKIAQSVDSTHGVFVLPAFSSGLTFPYWDQSTRGNIFGISLNTKKAHIVRAVLEGICFRIKDIVEGIQHDSGIRVKKLRADGGVSANRFVLQFLSDILGLPVEYFPHPEPTALGAAFMAGLSTGYWKSENEIAGLLERGETFLPGIDNAARKRRYGEWKDIIRRSLKYGIYG